MAAIDSEVYANLLAETLPHAIEDDAENERLIAEMERIDSLPSPSPEQLALAELIGVLVESCERRYDLGHAEPLAGSGSGI